MQAGTSHVTKVILIAAGLYNLAWGAYSSAFPQWLFNFAALPASNHPQIFQCLAMVIGIYGLLYLEASRGTASAFPIVAIGLLGKILGPIGWLHLFFTHAWPLKTIVLILTNDLIWWIPFTWCLKQSFPAYRRTWSHDAA